LEPHRSRITESAYPPCPYRNQLQLHNWRIYPIFETPYVFPMLLLTPNSNLTGLHLKLLYVWMANKGITYMVCVLAVQRAHARPN
jgi:hypothetical protein